MRARLRPLSLVLALVLVGCRSAAPTAVVHTRGGPVPVAIEVADTDATRSRGLMWRSTLADGQGMLFVFPEASEHTFWMKDTLIPLDMLFIGADGTVVGVHSNATPLSTAPIGVGRPSRWVLEVPGGWAARHGAAAGDRVELRGVSETLN